MSEISIIKKIQLGENTFQIENPYSQLSFSFYCGKGEIKHQTILSTETSFLLNSLIDSGQIDYAVLAQNDVDKLQNLEDPKKIFPYRYQMLNQEQCHNTYLLIFDIYEYREHYSCTIYAVLQIESIILINNYEQN